MRQKQLRTTGRRGKRQRGNAILEGALSLTVFFMMFFGIIDFGRMLWIYNTMAYVAREGSRYAQVRGVNTTTAATSSDVSTYAAAKAIGIASSDITITTTWTAVGWTPGPGVTANHVGDKVKVQA